MDEAWRSSGARPSVALGGLPRVVTARYFSLGPQADAIADACLEHYYGPEYFGPARSDTLTSPEGVRAELARLAGAGCADVVLYPCSGDLDQVGRLSQALAPTDPRLAHVPPRPHPLAERRPAQPPRCDAMKERASAPGGCWKLQSIRLHQGTGGPR